MYRSAAPIVSVCYTEGLLKCLVIGQIVNEDDEFIAIDVGDLILNIVKHKIIRITPIKSLERF